ncbi:hypothetical protein GCM10027589_23210 [Actinocorallia lasiicapitis]
MDDVSREPGLPAAAADAVAGIEPASARAIPAAPPCVRIPALGVVCEEIVSGGFGVGVWA